MKKTNITRKTLVLLLLVTLAATIVFLPACSKQGETPADQTGTLAELNDDVLEKELSYLPEDAEEDRAMYVEASSKMEKLVLPEDLALPADITENTSQPFGLYIFDGEKTVPYATEGVFDPNKKTLFFAHGMGYNGSFYNCKGYYENGYNVLCFYWGIFASEDIYTYISDKVWTRDGNHRYRLADGSWKEEDTPVFSVAEMYGAFYYDFLSRYPTYDKEIVIGGHSYGGMLTTALLSYLTTAFRCRFIPSRFLPDRVLLCDPFFRAADGGRHVRWLGDLVPPKKGSLVILAMQAVLTARQLGISVALFRSSTIIAGPFALAFYDLEYGTEQLNKFYDSLLYVLAPANGMLPQEQAHNYGESWPANVTWQVFDSVYPAEYAFSEFNPYHAEYARMGECYAMNYHNTPNIYTDDAMTLQNGVNAKLYGFAFHDANGNGEMDERLDSHIRGAAVRITAEDGTVVYEGTTSLNGYYEAKVQPGVYTIETVAPDGYSCETKRTVTVSDDAWFVFAPTAMRKNV